MPTIIEGTSENTEHPTETISSGAAEKETTTEIPSTELPTEEVSQIPDEELNIMQRVLLNMESFIDTEDGVRKNISTVSNELWNGRGMKSWYEPYGFLYIDLDGNATKEVIVLLESGIRMIFYKIDTQIYMDTLFRSEMGSLYEDGVFRGSLGAESRHTERIKAFTVTGIEIESILIERFQNITEAEFTTEYYKSWDDYNNRVNGIPKVEAMSMLENCSDVEATEYEFTRNNIETILKDYK